MNLPEIVPFLVTLFCYSMATFLVFLFLQPIYFDLVTQFKIKQSIREVASDGRKAEVYRKFHKKKDGTPTGGGIVIWASVLLVILFSRFLSFAGLIENSLLQRSEVYLPLFSLVFMGFLGAVDDFWNARKIGKKAGLEAGPKMIFLLFLPCWGHCGFILNSNTPRLPFPGLGFLILECSPFPYISLLSWELPMQ
jgi:phospho-N-acetylmuramoyl-pentapeptide-transferase